MVSKDHVQPRAWLQKFIECLFWSRLTANVYYVLALSSYRDSVGHALLEKTDNCSV